MSVNRHQVLPVGLHIMRQGMALNTVPFARRSLTFTNEVCADFV